MNPQIIFLLHQMQIQLPHTLRPHLLPPHDLLRVLSFPLALPLLLALPMPIMILIRNAPIGDRMHDVNPLRRQLTGQGLRQHAHARAAGAVGGVAAVGAEAAEGAGEDEGAAFEEGEFVGMVGGVLGEEKGGGQLGEVL
jgi:hypothetical protein